MDFEVGDVLVGKYEIKKLLGAGGMGKVYRARQVDLGRDVALKIPSQQVLESPEVMARFIREAKTVARLTHDNIVQVYEYHHEGDLAFIAMEFVEGQDMKAFVNAPPDDITVRDLCAILEGACEGLDHAHEYGIVHRDIKPHNIMVARLPRGKWRVKVMDFGIAHIDSAAQMTEMEGQLTQTGQALGTPSYMAPEQIRGSGVSHLSDLYSFGCVIYYAFTRQTVFSGSGLTVAVAHLNEMPPSIRTQLPGLPEALDQVILKCLDKDPAKRFQTAADLGHAVHESLTGVFDEPMSTIWHQSLQASDATIPIVKSPSPQTGQVSGSQLQEVQTKGTIDHSGFTAVGGGAGAAASSPPPAGLDATIPGKPLGEDIKPKKKSNPVPIIAGIGAMALIVGVGAAVILGRGGKDDGDMIATATPTPAVASPTASPTDTPAPESTPTPEPTQVTAVRPTRTPEVRSTPTPVPTATPDPRINQLSANVEIAMDATDPVPIMYNAWRAIMELHDRSNDEEFRANALSQADEVARRIVTSPPLRSIEGARFTMGNREGHPDESKEHTVQLSSYSIGVYEVTALEFATFLNAAPEARALFAPDNDTNVVYDDSLERYMPRSRHEMHPANAVSWYAASKYAEWLTGLTGRPFRLPTEAEWERAARGTARMLYPMGNKAPTSLEANFQTGATVAINERGGASMGSRLVHIGGNVAEWCSDWYDPDAYKEPNRIDPTGPTDAEAEESRTRRKVLRGGGFLASAEDLSLSGRGRAEPDAEEPDIGFRLALTR